MADKVRVPAETDHGTVLPPDASAVYFDPNPTPGNAVWNLLLPSWMDKRDEPVPIAIQLLTAFFIRVQRDPEFVRELSKWLKDQKDD